MNKNLNQYLTEGRKEYVFRLKFAVPVDNEMTDKLESCLDKYNVQSVSKASKTIMQKHPMDFGALTHPSEIFIVDVVLDYPVTAHDLQSYVEAHLGVPGSHLVVRSPDHPEEVQNDEDQKTETKAEPESLLDSDYEVEKVEDTYGDVYNQKMLADLQDERKERIFDVLNFEKDPTSEVDSDPEGFLKQKEGTKSAIPGKNDWKDPIKGM